MRRREVELSLVLVGVALLAWWSRPPTPKDEMYYHLAEGIARYNWGYYTESLDHYNWVLDHFPRNQDAFVGRARTHRAMGRNDRSIADYQQALKAGSEPYPLANEVAAQGFEGPSLLEAYNLCQEAYRRDEHCAMAFGNMACQLQHWDEAEKYLLIAQEQGENVDYELQVARSRGKDTDGYLQRLKKAAMERGQRKLEELFY